MVSFIGKYANLQNFHHFRVFNIYNFWLPKCMSRSRRTIFSVTPFDGKCQNIQINPKSFCANFHLFRDIKILKFYVQNIGQGHGVQFSQWRLPLANVKIYKCNFFTLFIFAKVLPVLTIVTHAHRQTHRHTETDTPVSMGEILQICLKIVDEYAEYKKLEQCQVIITY